LRIGDNTLEWAECSNLKKAECHFYHSAAPILIDAIVYAVDKDKDVHKYSVETRQWELVKYNICQQ